MTSRFLISSTLSFTIRSTLFVAMMGIGTGCESGLSLSAGDESSSAEHAADTPSDTPADANTSTESSDSGSDASTTTEIFPGMPRKNALSFVVGTTVYVGGGIHLERDQGTWLELVDLWAYDVQDKSWHARNDLPFPGQSGSGWGVETRASVVELDGVIFIYSTDRVWRYDSENDAWTPSPSFAGDTEYAPIMFTDGTSLHVGVGGHSERRNVGGYNLNVLIYDLRAFQLNPATMAWEGARSYPSLQGALYSVTLADETIFLGRDGGSSPWSVLSLSHGTGQTSALPSPPWGSDDFPGCVTVVDGRLVAVGLDTAPPKVDVTRQYEEIWTLDDTTEGGWTRQANEVLQNVRGDLQGLACIGVGDNLFTGLGYSVPASPPEPLESTTITHLAASDFLSVVVSDESGVQSWGWKTEVPFPPIDYPASPIRDLDSEGDAIAFVDSHGAMITSSTCYSGGELEPPPLLDDVLQRVEVTCYSTMGLTVDGTLVTQSEYYEELGQLPQSLNAEILDISLSTYGDHALILDEHGEVHFMGMDWTEVVHLPAETQSQIVAVAAGAEHALALSSSGEVFAWGSEDMGAIDIPVDIPLDIIAIDASGDASAALSADGILTIWGQSFTMMTVAQSIQGRIKAMRISPEHILVVLDDGALLDLGNVRGHSEQPLFFDPQTGP